MTRPIRALLPAALLLPLFLVASGAQDDCPATLEPTCEATDGEAYPITVSWTNDDPEGEYAEIEISRNGVVVATLVGGSDESYTDTEGPGGMLEYAVTALDLDGECVSTTASPCLVPVGFFEECYSRANDAEDFGGAGTDPSEFTFDVRVCASARVTKTIGWISKI